MEKLTSESEFQSIMENEPSFLLLKHSSTCPISRAAYGEYEQFLGEHSEIPGYYLVVQESRPLSNFIAEKFSIKHESPQIFYFNHGEVSWHTSHWDINKNNIEQAVQLR